MVKSYIIVCIILFNLPVSTNAALFESHFRSNSQLPRNAFFQQFYSTVPSGVYLNYSVFLGGNGYEEGDAIAVDSAGNIYVTGQTTSTNFPVKNDGNISYEGINNIFIVKIGMNGNLMYSTLIGGNGSSYANAIAVDSTGNSYITGTTYAADFHLRNSNNETYGGYGDVFIAKFSTTGDLLFSRYLGGNDFDSSPAIAIDSTGNIYVTGITDSSDFPMKNAFNTTFGGFYSTFITKFSPNGSLLLSSYLGQNGYSVSIAVDNNSNCYVSGNEIYTNQEHSHIFIKKFNSLGNLTFSTIFGGGFDDKEFGIFVDSENNLHIAGETSSVSFPLKNAFETKIPGNPSVFVAKFNTSMGLVFSTYLGGSNDNLITGFAVDPKGDSFINGITYSSDFPIINGNNLTYSKGVRNTFITKFNSNGALNFSTFIGIGQPSFITGIALDGTDNIYITGQSADSHCFMSKFSYGTNNELNLTFFYGSIYSTTTFPNSNVDFPPFTWIFDVIATALTFILIVCLCCLGIEFRKFSHLKQKSQFVQTISFKNYLHFKLAKVIHRTNRKQLSNEIFDLLEDVINENKPQ